MYRVRDLKYNNRWIKINGKTIKFLESWADVPEECIKYFQGNKEFLVTDSPVKVEEKPKKETMKNVK